MIFLWGVNCCQSNFVARVTSKAKWSEEVPQEAIWPGTLKCCGPGTVLDAFQSMTESTKGDTGKQKARLRERILEDKLNHVGIPTFWCTPKSSILIGFSIINHPFWGKTPYSWKHPNSFLPSKCNICWTLWVHPFRRVRSAWARSAAVWSRRSCASCWIAPSALMFRGEMIQIPLSQCNPSCVTMIGPSEATWSLHGIWDVLGSFGLKRVKSTRPLRRGQWCVGILRWWWSDAFCSIYNIINTHIHAYRISFLYKTFHVQL